MTEEIEVRVPRKVDARVADEIDATVAADIDVQVGDTPLAEIPAPARIQHAVPDRGRARELFERLAVLPDGRRGTAPHPGRAGGTAPAAGGVPGPAIP